MKLNGIKSYLLLCAVMAAAFFCFSLFFFTAGSASAETVGESVATDRVDMTAHIRGVSYEQWADGAKFCLDSDIRFWEKGGSFLVDEEPKGKALLDYITVNGKSVSRINEETAGNVYEFTTFPGSTGGRYATAVYVLISLGNPYSPSEGIRMNVYINKAYYETLSEIAIGVNEDFAYNDGTKEYFVSEAVNFRRVQGVFVNEKDIKGDVNMKAAIDKSESGIRADGSASVKINFTSVGENAATVDLTELGLVLNTLSEDAFDFSLIEINGKSMAAINASASGDEYAWTGAPFNPAEKFKKAAIIYVTNDFMLIKLHKNYVENEIGDAALTVSVKAGVSMFGGGSGIYYRLSETVSGVAVGTRRLLTVNTGVNGTLTDKVAAGNKLDLSKYAVTKEHYTFNGYTEADGVTPAADVMPDSDYTVNSKFTPIEYTIKFMNGGVQIGDTFTYNVETESVAEPTLPQETHYNLAWEEYSLDGGNKTVKAVRTPKTYTVTFMDGDNVIAVKNYNVEDPYIDIPSAPAKEGFVSGWQTFVLDGGDKVVEAVYEQIAEPSSHKQGCSSEIDARSFAVVAAVAVLALVVFVYGKNKMSGGVGK